MQNLVLYASGVSGKEKEDIYSILKLLHRSPGVLSREEKDFLGHYITLFERGKRTFPSVSYVRDKFPGFITEDQETLIKDLKDFKKYARHFLSERTSEVVSKQIMGLATEIREKGFSEEIVSRMLSIYRSFPGASVEEKLPDLGARGFDEIYAKKEARPKGVPFLCPEVDEASGGITPATVNTIFGWAGSYKTTAAVNIAYKAYYEGGYNVVFISKEISRDEILSSFLSLHSKHPKFMEDAIPHDAIRKVLLDEKQKKHMLCTVRPDFDSGGKGHIAILDETNFRNWSYMEIEDTLLKIQDLFGGVVHLVVMDYIQLMKYTDNPDVRGLTDSLKINSYVSFFRELAIKHEFGVLLVAQSNREGYHRAKKFKEKDNEGKFDMLALAEAHELERSSSRVLSIYTSDKLLYANECKVCLLKNRYGRTIEDPIRVDADPVYFTFGGQGSQVMVDEFTAESVIGGF